MYRIMCSFVFVATAAMTTVVSAVSFSENWDDLNGASRWSAPIVAQEEPNIPFDGSVDYAFDYSIIGAPPATNTVGGTTIGVAMETNTTLQCPPSPVNPNCTDLDEGEGVGIVPLSALANIPAGDFSLRADMYIFWNFLGGSTEYGTVGVFSGGTAAPVRFNIDNGDGLAWQVDGEGGSGQDMTRFENPPGLETNLGGLEAIPDGSIPGVSTCNPGVDCSPATAIGPQNQWVEMEIRSVAGIVTWRMNNYVLDTFDNSGGAFSGGTLLLGQSDPFNSVNPDDANGNSNVVVFDNIRLVIPEPSCLVLLGMAGLGMIGIRRRRL